MKKSFYEASGEIRERIRSRIEELLLDVGDGRVKDILMQRNRSSSFIKGILVYHLHKGLGGGLDEEHKIDLASKIEVFCSSGAILDNVVDRHEERNGETTYLREYGLNVQLAASQYALHFGLRLLFPFLGESFVRFADKYKVDLAVLGMIRTDVDKSPSLEEHLRTIGLSNGLFNEVPLVMAATVATTDEGKVDAVGGYGFNLGIGLGIYEELRDLLGQHGRRRATEVEEGRIITPLHLAKDSDEGFDYLAYLGRPLNDGEYSRLLKELIKRHALKATRDLVLDYLANSLKSLGCAVDNECIGKVKALSDSIEESMNEIIERVYKES